MSALSNSHEIELLNFLFTQATYPLVATQPNWYLGLFTSDPDEDGVATEVTGTAYARLALPRNTSHFTSSPVGSITLTETRSFAEAGSNWGLVRGWGLFTVASGVDLPKWKGLLTTPQQILAGDTFKVPAGINGLRLTLD